MLNWLRKLIQMHIQDTYVDPLQVPMDDWDLAKTMDRQRDAFLKLQQEGKSILRGYKPPEPGNGDRIDAHANKIGYTMPTQQKRILSKAGPRRIGLETPAVQVHRSR